MSVIISGVQGHRVRTQSVGSLLPPTKRKSVKPDRLESGGARPESFHETVILDPADTSEGVLNATSAVASRTLAARSGASRSSMMQTSIWKTTEVEVLIY